jgi:hypothetical protein
MILGSARVARQTGDYTHHLDSALIAAAERVSGVIFAKMTGAQAEIVTLSNRVA